MLEKFKRFPLVRFFYRFPGLVSFYHLSWAFLGAWFCGFPSKKIFVIGITGTKGKTTTVELLNAILTAAGKKTALISSLRVKIGDQSEKNKIGNSMPGRAYLQKFLKKAVAAKCNYALVEVTSQGAVLSRHKFINWNAGVLTNLAPEHIESHGSFEKYRDAKLAFLKYVGEKGGEIFLNNGDKHADFFKDKLSKYNPRLYSRDDKEIADIFPGAEPMRSFSGEPRFFPSDFNKDNVAAASAVALALGIPGKTIKETVHGFKGVPGRMEFAQRRPFSVVIDYAHTPDSLKAVYSSLKPNAHKLICVLGAAGGGRDKWKRPEMGKIAAEYCDEIVLTDEDPYDEKPEEILKQIESGFSLSAKRQAVSSRVILDRREAIKEAIGSAKEGDVVVLTGKGSEDFIHVAGGKKIPWNELEVAEDILREARG